MQTPLLEAGMNSKRVKDRPFERSREEKVFREARDRILFLLKFIIRGVLREEDCIVSHGLYQAGEQEEKRSYQVATVTAPEQRNQGLWRPRSSRAQLTAQQRALQRTLSCAARAQSTAPVPWAEHPGVPKGREHSPQPHHSEGDNPETPFPPITFPPELCTSLFFRQLCSSGSLSSYRHYISLSVLQTLV